MQDNKKLLSKRGLSVALALRFRQRFVRLGSATLVLILISQTAIAANAFNRKPRSIQGEILQTCCDATTGCQQIAGGCGVFYGPNVGADRSLTDGEGFIDGVEYLAFAGGGGGTANVSVSIVQGNREPLFEHSRRLYDYTTLLNVYQGCTSVAPVATMAPFNSAQACKPASLCTIG